MSDPVTDQKTETQKVPDAPMKANKEDWGEFAKTAVIAIILALVIRSLAYEPFNIPSGSMKPTLEIGDYLFVSKPTYGYSRYSFPLGLAPISGRVFASLPERGDVIVFKLPSNPSIDYIKRIIALPGETVQVLNGRLYINDQLVEREALGLVRDGRTVLQEYIETLPGGIIHNIYEETDQGPLDNTEKFTVPDEHYFVMGDNRDNSQDSRVQSLVGFVPFENIVGRADVIFFSTNGSAHLFEIWKWPWAIRFDRIFDTLSPIRPENEGGE